MNAPEIQPGRLKRLLRRMLDIYSPSGKEEELLEFLWSYCKRRGLPVVRQEVDERRYNLLLLPSEREPQLALVGHLDTVAAYDLERYGFEERGDRIFGLGAADMKGGCAAMLEAFNVFWEHRGHGGATAVLLLVGEEEEGDGAKALVQEFHVPWVIIGEPTDLRPCLGQYGYLEMQIVTRGQRVHASLARQVQSPIEGMLRIISGINQHLELNRPEVVCNIRDLFSPPTGFAVPDRCEAWLDLHMPPQLPAGSLLAELEEVLSRLQEELKVEATVRFTTVHGGFLVVERGRVLERLREVYGRMGLPWEPAPFPSHSDASVLWGAGMQTVVLGAGNLQQAHCPEEWISFEQVCRASGIYLELMMSMEL